MFQTLQKSFIFTDTHSLQSISLLEFIIFDGKYFEISNAIKLFNSKTHSLPEEKEFFYQGNNVLMEKDNQGAIRFYIEVGEDVGNQIQIEYSEKEIETAEEGVKKQRSKERTVLEVLVGVKKWRELYENKNRSEKKLSLQESAKQLGFNKKTLDDYYSYLRLAQSLGFDFQNHLHEGMGTLRNYVRINRRKLKSKHRRRNQRLPRELMILETVGLESMMDEMVRNPLQQGSKSQVIAQNKFNGQETGFSKNVFSSEPWVVDEFICLEGQREMAPFSLDFLDIL